MFGIYTVAGGGIGAMNGNLTFNPSPGGIFGIIVLPFFTATFSYWIIFRCVHLIIPFVQRCISQKRRIVFWGSGR